MDLTVEELILELQHYSALERAFRYGPIKTLALALNRVLNHEVYFYFEKFLTKLDKAIDYSNSTSYKVNLNRIDIGELYNITKMSTATVSINFFHLYFTTLNKFILELVKPTIDFLFDNDIPLKNVNSINSLNNIKHPSKLITNMQEVLRSYQNILQNKPTSFMNIISDLKRMRLDSTMINTIVLDLEREIVLYIKSKYATSDKSVISYSRF
jgi:hypothetical protein